MSEVQAIVIGIRQGILSRLAVWITSGWQLIFELRTVIFLATVASLAATYCSFSHGVIVAYGDAESHLNISKRVVDSLTPGFAQLGGIWLPLPHLLMAPLTLSDFLWRTGLAGSIVSGIAFVISIVYLYKLTYLITLSKISSFFAAVVFILNPNILYMQSTPMTEILLICFFITSSYFFVRFIKKDDILSLILAGLFGFLASLTRYDGWMLVAIEAVSIILLYIDRIDQVTFKKVIEGKLIIFTTLAFFGIALWLIWDSLILGDPMYFTNSPFSAKSQQSGWLAKGELPTYHNLGLSAAYYLLTAWQSSGKIMLPLAALGVLLYLLNRFTKERLLIVLLLSAPFIFYVVTLFVGQSVIFLPDLTPISFDWQLFNVRYGLMVVPAIAIFLGYLFFVFKREAKLILVLLLVFQCVLFALGYTPVLTLDDGINGLSAFKRPDAQDWIAAHYDNGFVLFDDYARTISVVRTKIPMKEIIYVGNKPYWEESLKEPEKYARWVIMQKDDTVWRAVYNNEVTRGRLFKYFEKAYTSPDILIFRRNATV